MEEKIKLYNYRRREKYRKSDKCKKNIREEPDSDSPAEESKKKTVKRKNPGPLTNRQRKIQAKKENDGIIRDQVTEPPSIHDQTSDLPEIVEASNIIAEEDNPHYVEKPTLNLQYVYSRPHRLNQHFNESEVFESLMEENRAEEALNLSEWKKRKASHKKKWNESRPIFYDARMSTESPDFKYCSICSIPVHQFLVCCKTCKKELCVSCDKNTHLCQPFHERIFYRQDVFLSQRLLPTNFVDSISLEVTVQGIPVPCHVPSSCPSCAMSGTLNLKAGLKEKYVITLNGRFDLNASIIHCSDCNYSKELSEIDYLQSHWWPGAVSGSCYLFSETLLEFWWNLNHQYCGASTNKFVATLSRMSIAAERNETIDVTLFEKASREYQVYQHGVDVNIRLIDVTKCPSCGDPSDDPATPLQTEDGILIRKRHACLDGNVKVNRLDSASVGDGQSLFGDLIIASNDSVNEHISTINTNIDKGQKINPCGGGIWKAAKETSVGKKNYKETGLVISCCRHLVILFAVNMFVGETYRHAHFLHEKLYQRGYRVLCYDIVCLYWKWAKKIGDYNEHFRKRFSCLTQDMTAFLPRWHGVAHVWHCFIKNVGHYQEGVGATVGEEMEQVNASISLYGNKTKHMTEENRNDELTAGMLYLNKERLRRMPTFLAKRMARARILVDAYWAELKKMLRVNHLDEKDLHYIKAQLIKMAEDCAEKNVEDSEGPPSHLLTDLEGLFFEYQNAQKKVADATSSVPRTRAVRHRSEIKKKAAKIIDQINEWHRNAMEDTDDVVTLDDFLKGLFPWQINSEKDEFKKNRHLIECWMLALRYKEEIILLESEMEMFLLSTERSIQSLKQKINEMKNENVNDRSVLAKIYLVQRELTRLKNVKTEAKCLFDLPNYDMYEILSECESDVEINE